MAEHFGAIPGKPLPSITDMYRDKEQECDSLRDELESERTALKECREARDDLVEQLGKCREDYIYLLNTTVDKDEAEANDGR